MSKNQLTIFFNSDIIHDVGSPLDWICNIREDAIPILSEDPFIFHDVSGILFCLFNPTKKVIEPKKTRILHTIFG